MLNAQPKNFATVNKLCCCLKLETGMTILAWVKVIISIIGIMFSVVQIIVHDTSIDYLTFHFGIEGISEFGKYISM